MLVAVPNGGTPLATGARWENTIGLVANIADALPDNPWTMAADFVASGIVWLASQRPRICRAWPRWTATARW